MIEAVEVARREEARQALGTAEIADEAFELESGGWASFGGVGSWANQAAGLGLAGPVSDDELDRLVDFYVTRGVEPKIEVCPFVDASLVRGLAQRGFELREFENVLARHVDAKEGLSAALPHALPEGFAIECVDKADASALDAFVEASLAGFYGPGEEVQPHLAKFTRRCVVHPRGDGFVARIDGSIVGTAAMETTPDVACLFAGSVLTDFRRRGVQAALIVARLERARELGTSLVCIHSAPGIPTERNAARVGFGVAYTKAVLAMPGEGLSVSP